MIEPVSLYFLFSFFSLSLSFVQAIEKKHTEKMSTFVIAVIISKRFYSILTADYDE
jgi:hypothetical protein